MMGDKLKRCPFCLTRDGLAVGEWGPSEEHGVACELCDMRGPVMAFREGAIAAWNALPRKRKAARPKREAVEAALGSYAEAISAPCPRSPEGAAAYHARVSNAFADLLALLGYGPKGGDA